MRLYAFIMICWTSCKWPCGVGVTCAELREKHLSTGLLSPRHERSAAESMRLTFRLMINDRVDVAWWHRPMGCMSGRAIRRWPMCGSDAGRFSSVCRRIPAQTMQAASCPRGLCLDYVGWADHPTVTKSDAAAPWAWMVCADRAMSSVPIVAIGGIGVDNPQAGHAAGCGWDRGGQRDLLGGVSGSCGGKFINDGAAGFEFAADSRIRRNGSVS